jgi:hypothetical protein
MRMRAEGRLMPRWQVNTRAGVVAGELLVAQQAHRKLRRAALMARLVEAGTGEDLVPPLIDVSILYVKHNNLVLTGFETIEDQDFAQTWMLANDPDALQALS